MAITLRPSIASFFMAGHQSDGTIKVGRQMIGKGFVGYAWDVATFPPELR